ncbi:ankyrin repeat-containing domain protein [Suillus discolor]|uniref:Ankyrin repeat-containing domain protein n=1 Tax=Suillus discolor TaxID=1912936 RepID=A0A9P7F4U3_9AGAM|nr:ankyrin repeat-containing domain protein [Suillus discolor]KAG2107306.1 ankyrin repeat-containing domain protein [Suillus discolor]
MPVPARVQPGKNIWVAAGDGDLVRVRVRNSSSLTFTWSGLIRSLPATSPNAPDEFTYTPMHAAASYGQLETLAYLFSQGGDVNVTDEDGDTPLYAVENTETAQWLLDHGSTLDHQNNDGVSPIEHLQENFPEIAAYLQSRLNPSSCVIPGAVSPSRPSQYQQDIATESLTSSLMQSVHDIMQRSEADGRDPDEELRQVVGRIVFEGVAAGYDMTTDSSDAAHHSEANGVKRPRTDGSN